MTQLLALTTSYLTGITAVEFSPSLPASDVATMEQLVVNDLAARQQSESATPLQAAVVFTADTATTVGSGLTSVQLSSPAGATIASIQPGQFLYGPNIPVGATVLSVSGSTIHFSGTDTPLATQSQATFFVLGQKMEGSFNRQGQLVVPNRGVLKMLPGDVVAVDPSGWPILLSAQALAYAGTCWRLT